MSKITLKDVLDGELEEINAIVWSVKYAMPVFRTKSGKYYVPETGEYAGYFDRLTDAPNQTNQQNSKEE